MKTPRHERITRVIFGLGVMAVGSFSFMEVAIAGYLFGLLLIGIGLYPASTEYPEDYVEKTAKAAPSVAPSAPAKKVAARKRKSAK